MDVQGICDERFARVREEFEKNFSERDDVGGSFCATLDGEVVIDLWGGHRDLEKTKAWEEDTIVNVYSTTKTMTFLSALMLADQGKLDLDAPVANYWPEFAAEGKGELPVKFLLAHTAGLPGPSRAMSDDEMYDWDLICADLAAQKPWWEPGTQSGYHAITQGYLIGEVVRRVTGKTIGNWFREEVASKVDADFHIGLDPQHFGRTSDILPAPAAEGVVGLQMEPDSMTAKVFSRMGGGTDTANSPGWRQAEIPAANGHGNARSVVRAQTAMANGGEAFGTRLLSAEGVERARELQIDSTDLVLGFPIKFGMGYGFGGGVLPICPKENAIFWAGAGGSTIIIDPDRRLCFSYVMNQMAAALIGDVRGTSLSLAMYEGID